MAEPTLEAIDDYNELKGDKKKVVYIVVLVSLIIGAIYSISYNFLGNAKGALPIDDPIAKVPVSKALH